MALAIILDDLKCRHDEFDRLYGEKYKDILHAYNFAEFFHLFTTVPAEVDLVTLDHDLGDSTHYSVNTGKIVYGTGMSAVRLLEIVPEWMRPKEVKVHSHNYERSDVMLDRLQRAGYQCVIERFTDE